MAGNQVGRPRFYEGQYLGAEDLGAGIEYGRIQGARHALGGHTWGIAMGLEVKERDSPAGGSQVDAVIQPGYAWDGFGRPIVVLAPYKIPTDLFKPYAYDAALDEPNGRLVEVWLRYDEAETRRARPGFEVCDVPDQYSRVQESFILEVGARPTLLDQHDTISVAGNSVDARQPLQKLDATAPLIYDESIPYQSFPEAGEKARWLIPLGYVRWKPNPNAAQPGTFVKSPSPDPDREKKRAFRRYIGVVAQDVQAADGIIRLRERTQDPSKKSWSQDLVWVEGDLRIDGKLDLCNSLTGVLQWQVNGAAAGLTIGEASPSGAPDARVYIKAGGNVGIGTANPAGRLTINGIVQPQQGTLTVFAQDADVVYDGGSDGLFIFKDTGGKTAFVGGNVGIGTTNPTGRLTINGIVQPQQGALTIFSQDADITYDGGSDGLFVFKDTGGRTAFIGGNVGIGTTAPVSTVQIGGDVALQSRASGAPRSLPPGGTMLWNDGTWLRLNQNLDFGKPIFGVHTPGVFAPGSLNVGGAAAWGDPGAGNAWISGSLGLGTTSLGKRLEVNGSARITGRLGTNNLDPDSGYPGGWGGGIHTWDLVADGSITSPNKLFMIRHPLDPENKRLLHSTLEGPEMAVFYRGEAQLSEGEATIVLPDYFEALTRREGRTVLVTPKCDAEGPISLLAASEVVDGRFTVRVAAGKNPSQKFYWEVKAVRSDVESLKVEVARPVSQQAIPATA